MYGKTNDPLKSRRNKEVHTGIVEISIGVKLRDVQMGVVFEADVSCGCFGWYVLEKHQWFYWTVFYIHPQLGERLVTVRRDQAVLRPGTYRVQSRDVLQKRLNRVFSHHRPGSQLLPTKPGKKLQSSRKEDCTFELRRMYLDFFDLYSNVYRR